ncbi:MAG TPA: UDP-N-acetylmuramoyl-L-alanyl-D-glutamate--2,6-diaminopimelate ligase [Terriglobales bacterium]|nr:UDP-N-acetylmuramoyl-L-alanyl-D-glutamate--2,6-diaminopimelate ligase [Terriglobales bacterium]
MTFQSILDGAEVLFQRGDATVTGVEYDSRRVKPGCCFVAMRGEKTDGSRYIDAAIAAGAVAVVSDSADAQPRGDVAWATVSHGRRALARISSNFYKRPAEKLAATGITGTNGKTTTSFLIESILKAADRKSALVGTIEYHIGDRVIPAPHTTPESLELMQVFAEAVGQGATEAVMEVSSHALDQQRIYGVPFQVAVFTNLTRDHLDYHKTFEEYFAAKKALFEGCGTEPPAVSVINLDDAYGADLIKSVRGAKRQVISYGLERGDFHAARIELGLSGTRFDIVMPDAEIPMWTPLAGRVNVYNVLAAAASAFARGCSAHDIAAGVAKLKCVPGRFETVNMGQPFAVAVDYAHTDDALRNLTALARDFVSRNGHKGRVITVFGCGGDRDRAKRPLMGEAAGRGSDLVIVTSDNPRTEDPVSIINDALPGVQRSGVRYMVEPDRRKAIARAIGEARARDIVLLAGKGHEKTQTTREGVFPFDDVQVAREELANAGYEGTEN